MKHLLTLIIALMPLCALSQTSESNNYFNQGQAYFGQQKYAEALACLEKCDSLDKIQLAPSHQNYSRAEYPIAMCRRGIANQLGEQGNYDEAIKQETLAIATIKKLTGEDNIDYADAINILATFYFYIGDIDEAIRLQHEVVGIVKKITGEDNPTYVNTLTRLTWYYERKGNIVEATKYRAIATELLRKNCGEENEEYLHSMCDLATKHNFTGNFAEAIRIQSIVVDTQKKTLGESNAEYLYNLRLLARYYKDKEDYTEAIRLQKQQTQLAQKYLGEESAEYAAALNDLGLCYHDLGDNDEAIRLLNMAMELQKKLTGEDNLDYSAILNNLAECYSATNKPSEALKIGLRALEISEKHKDERGINYIYSLNNVALYYSELNQFDEAIRTTKTAMDIYKDAIGEENPTYCMLAHNLASSYMQAGKYAEAIRLLTKTMDIEKKFFSEGNLQYIAGNIVLSNCYLSDAQYDKATDWFAQSFRLLSSYVLKYFASLTTKERATFWDKFSKVYRQYMPNAAYTMSANNADPALLAKISGIAYNCQVFSKGLLLNAELEIQKIIEQSGDPDFAAQYYKLKQDRAILDALYQTPVERRTADADSLLRVIEKEERQLVESSKELGDFTKNLSIDWTSIQKQLKGGDIAIEFANFKDASSKQDIYIAFVLKKGMKSPEVVKLFESDDFWAVKTGDYYKTTKLYDLVWKPLEKYLDGVKNVYFSPTGRFHTIGIEYLPDEDGKIFAEKYDAYRLSSTRELVLGNTANTSKSAVTFGGIKYDLSDDEWQKVKDEDADRRSFSDVPHIDNSTRGGVMNYLEGTKKESDEVAALLRAAKYDVSAISDATATEERFKLLSGTNLKILHIGTHGFYQSEADMENAGYRFFQSGKESAEERSLSCSGLMFAGANSALDPQRSKNIPDGVDDGVLTAKEISRLDFRGLDLVVLSACQTGLGEVSGEGVFGLQRGFKKAGAQTIVMSLWEVSDESTQLLMTEFFKNLTAGQSKRAAFLAAQNVVRQKYPNPLHWAAFVMVDGM